MAFNNDALLIKVEFVVYTQIIYSLEVSISFIEFNCYVKRYFNKTRVNK